MITGDLSKNYPVEVGLEPFRKSRISWGENIRLGDRDYSPAEVIEALPRLLTVDRVERLKRVIAGRSRNFVSVLENIYDLGNISAVMRSAEAFGFLEMHLVKEVSGRFKVANRVTKGAEKWLDVHSYHSARESVQSLKARGFQVWATHLESSRPISEIDFSKPTAVVLGNEKEGVSEDLLDVCDGRFVVPMQGFSQSFNISVAAAITFYHAWTERVRHLGGNGDLNAKDEQMVYANYLLRCFDNPEQVMQRLVGR